MPKSMWRCGGSNPGPFTCKANALPLSYIPSKGLTHQIEEETSKSFAPGEARTHGLQIMRLTRCLLRYGGTVFKEDKISLCGKQKIFVPTGGLEPPIFGLGDRRLIH
jgi:hypothetical protein